MTIPAAAQRFADKALAHGWRVRTVATRGPILDDEGEPKRQILYVDKSDEEGGGRRQVLGDVKIVDTVVVACDRGLDVLVARWADGAFAAATRPTAAAVGLLSSVAAGKHLERPPDQHRWIPIDASTERCLWHCEDRPKELV